MYEKKVDSNEDNTVTKAELRFYMKKLEWSVVNNQPKEDVNHNHSSIDISMEMLMNQNEEDKKKRKNVASRMSKGFFDEQEYE